MRIAHIIKASDEDLAKSLRIPISSLVKKYLSPDKIIIHTMGDKGVEVYYSKKKIKLVGLKVKIKDTIGAGDTFMACFLHLLYKNNYLTQNSFLNLDETLLSEITQVANQAAAFNCTQTGTNPPYRETLKKITKHLKPKKVKL